MTLAAVALCLDAVDGWVARRTGEVTELGARFDGEVDAFLILALSVYVAPECGWWVLAIGAARYLFLAGEWLLPWMRAPLPPRRWRKLVAATQGIVLTVAAAGVLPRALAQALLLAALALLTASMAQCTWWLWRRRHTEQRGQLHAGITVVVTLLALLLVWATLVAPNQPADFNVTAFLRLPLELLVVVAVAVLLPATPRRVLVVVLGVVLSVLILVKVLDIGFFTAFDRPFRPLDDTSYLGIGIETLGEAVGTSTANLIVAAAAVLILAILAIPVLALLRVTRVAAGQRAWALRAAAVLGVIWVALRVVGAPVASSSAAALAVDEVQGVRDALASRAAFTRQIAHDRFGATPGNRLLTGLRGKDVLVVFVESYGKVAVQDSSVSPRIDAVLERGNAQLRAAGFSSRSAFLTSPTFGGLSWLAHSTLQSGVTVNGQWRYDQVAGKHRVTLTRAFKRAGWRAVGAMPGNRRAWPEGSTFYRYDQVYDRRNLGYRGPAFGLPPDARPVHAAGPAASRARQASPAAALRRGRPHLEPRAVDAYSAADPLGRRRRRLDLRQPARGGVHAGGALRRCRAGPSRLRALDRVLAADHLLVRARYGDDNLVLVVLGDHQPATLVTGHDDPSHDVPISVIAHDPKVIDQIAGWSWQDGMSPSPQAPVWPMAAFRDRFLTAFGSSP